MLPGPRTLNVSEVQSRRPGTHALSARRARIRRELRRRRPNRGVGFRDTTPDVAALPPNATLSGVSICSMTAKEKLRARVEDLTEQEAEAALDFIASRGQSFGDWLDARPENDEPLTPEEEGALAESDADIAAGDTISYEQVKQEIGSSGGGATGPRCASRAALRRLTLGVSPGETPRVSSCLVLRV